VVAAARLDACDVAEAGDELAAVVEVVGERADVDAEDLDPVPRVPAREARRLVEPGVLLLRAVEEVAPEGLLVVPPQAPLVGVAVAGGQAAVEESLVAGGGSGQRQSGRDAKGGGGKEGKSSGRRVHAGSPPVETGLRPLLLIRGAKSFRRAETGRQRANRQTRALGSVFAAVQGPITLPVASRSSSTLTEPASRMPERSS